LKKVSFTGGNRGRTVKIGRNRDSLCAAKNSRRKRAKIAEQLAMTARGDEIKVPRKRGQAYIEKRSISTKKTQ